MDTRRTGGLPTRAAALILGLALPLWAVAGRRPISEDARKDRAAKRTLDNGLTLISEVEGTTATTAVQIVVKGGKLAQPPGRTGLAFLATRLAVEIPDDDKIQELIAMASSFQVGVQGDYSHIQLECLSGELEPTLRVLSKVVGDPLFSGWRVDSVKKFADHQGRIEEDDSVRLGQRAALSAFSGEPGYGGSVYGDKESLEETRGKDISEFYKKHFVGPNIVIAVSSDRADAAELVAAAFGRFPAGPAPAAPRAVFRVPGDREFRLAKETKQAFVSEAFLLPGLTPRGLALGLLLENIIGKGPASRLWPLRSVRKLAYNVNAAVSQMRDGGIVVAYLETDRDKTLEARQALREVLSDLRRSGVADDELKAARISVWGGFLRDNEARPARALSLAAFEALGLGPEAYYGLRAELESVSLDTMNALIRDALAPENSVSVVIGPGQGEPPGPPPQSSS